MAKMWYSTLFRSLEVEPHHQRQFDWHNDKSTSHELFNTKISLFFSRCLITIVTEFWMVHNIFCTFQFSLKICLFNYYQVPQCNTNNLLSGIKFQVFRSNTNNLYAVVWSQLDISKHMKLSNQFTKQTCCAQCPVYLDYSTFIKFVCLMAYQLLVVYLMPKFYSFSDDWFRLVYLFNKM